MKRVQSPKSKVQGLKSLTPAQWPALAVGVSDFGFFAPSAFGDSTWTLDVGRWTLDFTFSRA